MIPFGKLLNVFIFPLLLLVSPIAGAQMKSIDFPDTIPFRPLQDEVVQKVPFHLWSNQFWIVPNTTILVPAHRNKDRSAEHTFWMNSGKKLVVFKLNPQLEFDAEVGMEVSEIPIRGNSFYRIDFSGQTSVSCLNDAPVKQCASFYWVDAKNRQVLDFTVLRTESWSEVDFYSGDTLQSSVNESATVTITDSVITIEFFRERFTPEPNYHLFLQNYVYTYRLDPIGWIKESERME
jgi:hypothetical protein